MAVFKSEKVPSLRVFGAGKFEKGSLEVTGDAAAKVRRLVGNEKFGITEEKPKPAARTAKATDEKPADDTDAKSGDDK